MTTFAYLFRWNTRAAAIADAQMLGGKHYDSAAEVRDWLRDHVTLVDRVWRASQDSTDAEGNVVHSYLPGYYAIVMLQKRVQELDDLSGLQFVINVDKMNAGLPNFIVKSSLSAAVLKDIRFEPIVSGWKIPWGGLN